MANSIRGQEILNTSHAGNSEQYSFDSIAPLEGSPLEGKRVCVLGSSVVDGYASQGWSIPEYLSRRFSCECAKEAVSGTTLVDTRSLSYVSRLHDLRAKCGIGVIDLWNGESFNKIPDELRAVYMEDDIHPTKAGYRDWWGPEIERQLLLYIDHQEGQHGCKCI